MADFRKLNAEDLPADEITNRVYDSIEVLTDDECDVYMKYADDAGEGKYSSDFFKRNVAEIQRDLQDDGVTEAVAIALYWEAADNEA